MITIIVHIICAFVYALAWTLYFRFGWIRFGFIRNNPKFWNAQASYSGSKTVGGYKIDGFHLLQSACFGLFALSAVLYQPLFSKWIDLGILFGVWAFLFPLFYGFIAPRPKRINDRL